MRPLLRIQVNLTVLVMCKYNAMLNESKIWRGSTSKVITGHWCPEVSAHSLLPICTNREQQRAKAKISSSPLNMELVPMTDSESPYRHSHQVRSREESIEVAYQVIHDASLMI